MPRAYRIDPDVLRERNRKAGIAAHGLDAHIKAVVDRASELSAEQRDKLATLLRTSAGAAS